MYRISSRAGHWLAAAAATTLVGVGVPTTAGAAAPPPVPPGYVTLTDDTNRISIMVPPTWVDVQTGPVDVGGTPVPAISAAPNIQSFLDTFDTPGVRYFAFPFAPDPTTLIAQFGLQGGCASIATQPYDDTGFVGVVQVGTGCGAGGQATWNMVSASLPDQSFTAVVQIQTASPADQVDFDAVLSTFGTASLSTATPTAPATPTLPASPTVAVTPTVPVATAVPLPSIAPVATVPAVPVPTVAAVPVATVPAVPVPTVAAVPVATVPGPAPTPTVAGAATIALTDDTGLLTVEVPANWLYHETAPSDVGQAIIYASPDGQAADGTVPSLLYIGGTVVADTATVLANLGGLAEGCTPTPAEPYDDNIFVGHMQTFTQCNGTQAVKLIIVATPPSQSTTVTVVLTMPVFDEPLLLQILETFNVTR